MEYSYMEIDFYIMQLSLLLSQSTHAFKNVDMNVSHNQLNIIHPFNCSWICFYFYNRSDMENLSSQFMRMNTNKNCISINVKTWKHSFDCFISQKRKRFRKIIHVFAYLSRSFCFHSFYPQCFDTSLDFLLKFVISYKTTFQMISFFDSKHVSLSYNFFSSRHRLTNIFTFPCEILSNATASSCFAWLKSFPLTLIIWSPLNILPSTSADPPKTYNKTLQNQKNIKREVIIISW